VVKTNNDKYEKDSAVGLCGGAGLKYTLSGLPLAIDYAIQPMLYWEQYLGFTNVVSVASSF